MKSSVDCSSSWSLETGLGSYECRQSVHWNERLWVGKPGKPTVCVCFQGAFISRSHENRASLDDSSRGSTAISASNSVNKVLMVKKKKIHCALIRMCPHRHTQINTHISSLTRHSDQVQHCQANTSWPVRWPSHTNVCISGLDMTSSVGLFLSLSLLLSHTHKHTWCPLPLKRPPGYVLLSASFNGLC